MIHDSSVIFYFTIFQDSGDELPAGEDSRSVQAHQEILKSAASQKSMLSDEAIALSMEATKNVQKKLLEKSVAELVDNFPIYKVDSMVSRHVKLCPVPLAPPRVTAGWQSLGPFSQYST